MGFCWMGLTLRLDCECVVHLMPGGCDVTLFMRMGEKWRLVSLELVHATRAWMAGDEVDLRTRRYPLCQSIDAMQYKKDFMVCNLSS
jgi:hypothetical protein